MSIKKIKQVILSIIIFSLFSSYTKNINENLDPEIIKLITDYYDNVYSKSINDSSDQYLTYYKVPVKKTENDSLVEYRYSVQAGKGEDSFVMFCNYTCIPKKSGINLYESNPIIYSDLNGDGIEDLIVIVHNEGGWAGSNGHDQEVFIFLNENGEFKLKKVSSLWDLSGSQINGYIRINNIVDGVLISTAYGYAGRDSNCCPSLRYKMEHKFINGKFKIVSTKLID